MLTILKKHVKSLGRAFGIEFRRYRPDRSEMAQSMAMLSAHRINLIFDVGANIGQFGKSLREGGYRGRIISFEPLSSARNLLLAVSDKDADWEVATCAAIGDEDGEIDIHIAGNSASSSVLDMLDTHSNAAPESRYIGAERVPLRRLDTLALDYLRPDSIPFLKIDTQGYEDRVLRGAGELLGRIHGLQLEISLVPLYDDQVLMDELMGKVKAMGFNLWAIRPVFFDRSTGRLLQIDATFFRS